MNVNICLGRRAGAAPSQRTLAEECAPARCRGEDSPVPDLVARGALAQAAPGFSWQHELTEQPLSRRAGERQTLPHRMTPAARPEFDPRVVGDAFLAVLRDGQASSDSGTPEWDEDEDRSDGAHGSAPKPGPGRPAEPWWRVQISQQMDHARLESTERQRRQRIATVLADNEQHRRVAQQQAYAMEDEQERVRRRAFARIVLDEEQHSRVCEDHGADMRDIADRNRRRRWALKTLREEEARMTMERLELRAIEQGRADPHTPYSRALVERACVQQSVVRRNRALMLAGLKLHVHYMRAVDAMEEEGTVGRGARTGTRRTRIDQAIFDLYTRDCLNVPRAAPPNAPGQEAAVSVCAVNDRSTDRQTAVVRPDVAVYPRPLSFEQRMLEVRRQAFKQDFDTAIKPSTGSVRALSAHAVNPHAWGGYLSREKGTRYSPAGPDGYVSNQGVALSNQGLALAPNLPHASGPLPNGALPSRPRNSSRASVSPSGASAEGLAESHNNTQKTASSSLSALTSLFQRSLLMPSK